MTDREKIQLNIDISHANHTGNQLRDFNVLKEFENIISNLKEGDWVRFSGYFKEGSRKYHECLATASSSGFTSDGRGCFGQSIDNTDTDSKLYNNCFYFQFSKIEKNANTV